MYFCTNKSLFLKFCVLKLVCYFYVLQHLVIIVTAAIATCFFFALAPQGVFLGCCHEIVWHSQINSTFQKHNKWTYLVHSTTNTYIISIELNLQKFVWMHIVNDITLMLTEHEKPSSLTPKRSLLVRLYQLLNMCAKFNKQCMVLM